jgi:hypothetical protein
MSYQWTGIIGKIVKIGAIVLIPISYLAMTYSNWWKAPAASLLIALLATIAWSRQGLSVIGLKIPSDQIGVSLLILFIVTISATVAIPAIATAEDIFFIPNWEKPRWTLALSHTIGQTLNEEIVMGALLLKPARNRPNLLFICAASIIIAGVFSLGHYLFYLAIPAGFFNHGTLTASTLVSLFAIGVVRNNCILGTNHIGYAWAIHLGWNTIFINSDYYIKSGRWSLLPEPVIFNTILGNKYMALVNVLLMGLSFMLLLKKKATSLPPSRE